MSKTREKVVVAMSGGVDSSVAACLLVEAGYDVVGLFMRTGVSEPQTEGRDEGIKGLRDQGTKGLRDRGEDGVGMAPGREHKGCCSASDAADARFVAGMLDIPFYALNFERDFNELIDYFADEYVNGRTPNPCVVCNDRLKFGKLVDYADAVGAKYIATGHYARVEQRDGRNVLLRGHDAKKDQSYVLFGLGRNVLDRVMFPIGDVDKSEVRRLAAEYNLPNTDKPDSVDICFVPDRDYARVVRERRPEAFRRGDVLDQAGEVIGSHEGIGHYTIGQRRGLGIAAGKPIYVTELNVGQNTVTLGDSDELLCSTLMAERANFLVDLPGDRFRADVKIRYLHKAAPATVELLSNEGGMAKRSAAMCFEDVGARGIVKSRRAGTAMPHQDVVVRITFDEPQRAITPGQAVVFYDGDVVLGGAWITGGRPRTSPL